MNYLLKDLTWYDGPLKISGDVRVRKGIIQEIGAVLHPKGSELMLDFGQHYLYPGLINAHDHLEMNLYPRLGTPPYHNYLEWSRDIYKPDESPIREIQQVNIKDRLIWGGLKNLISGATSVVHHNPWHRVLGKDDFPVNVVKQITWAHSLGLEKDRKRAFRQKDSVPFIIHAGEGVDALAQAEIPELQALGLLTSNTVLIHAIALNDNSISSIVESASAIVWCPESNVYLFGETAPIARIKEKIKIAIGTDSTLTGSSTLLDELKVSAKVKAVTNGELYKMVTSNPADIFRTASPTIQAHAAGDLFITPIQHVDYLQNLMMTTPATISAVLAKGRLSLLDAEITATSRPLKYFITIGGTKKYTYLDVTSLKTRINKKVDSNVLEQNPLWKLIEV